MQVKRQIYIEIPDVILQLKNSNFLSIISPIKTVSCGIALNRRWTSKIRRMSVFLITISIAKLLINKVVHKIVN